jgi:hypothetical protein
MPATWTTKEQVDFLKAELPGFCSAQRLQRAHVFMRGLAERWFERWPEHNTLVSSTVDTPLSLPSEDDKGLTEAIKKRKKARSSTPGV